MAFELRPYQRAAVDAAIAHVKKSLAPCLLELCTGAGKSALVSEIARFFAEVAPSKRILCMAPSRELVMQNHYRYTVDYGYPASVIDRQCFEVMDAAANELGLKNIQAPPSLGAEDFAYYGDFARPGALEKVMRHTFLHDGTYSSFRRAMWGAPVDDAVDGHAFDHARRNAAAGNHLACFIARNQENFDEVVHIEFVLMQKLNHFSYALRITGINPFEKMRFRIHSTPL